jgi:hypothetical protein
MTETLAYQKTIPIAAHADVLVVGGGPAGIAAAVASARIGARTLLVERYGFLGGNLTAGLVGPCMTAYSLDGAQQLIRGVFEELVERMEAIGGAIHPSKIPAGSPYAGYIVHGHDKVTPFDPEAVKICAAELCLEAGVELLLHTFVADTLMDGAAVTGVVAANKGGMQALEARVVVDCSADADVAVRAGVPSEVGRAEDGLTQPMTMFFRVANVDDERVQAYVESHPDDFRPFASIVAQARAQGAFPVQRRGIGMYRTLQRGVWRINTSRIHHKDGTDPHDLTAAEVEGRRQVLALIQFFQAWLPGFEHCTLVDTAVQVGVRETRRIVGEYTLTFDDLASGRDFDDVIALCGYPVDIHSPTGDGGGMLEDLPTANTYQIPYRSLVPLHAEQLLVAGRCVSATHEALGAIRVMPPSFAMGQAAGAAAALAVQTGVTPRELSVELLQTTLAAQGAYLGELHTPQRA